MYFPEKPIAKGELREKHFEDEISIGSSLYKNIRTAEHRD